MGSTTRRATALFLAMATVGGLVLGCSARMSSDAPTSLELAADSGKAIVLLGSSVDRSQEAPKFGLFGTPPRLLLTHWQQYDPGTLQLVPGGTRMKSLRSDEMWEGTTSRDPMVQVLEVDPGDYALIGVTITRTLTLFVKPEGPIRHHYQDSNAQVLAGIETTASVTPKSNFLFSMRPGQIVYIGDFDFVQQEAGSNKITKVNYSHDEAAARAALQSYPGITGDMVTLNLTLPTEQAALP